MFDKRTGQLKAVYLTRIEARLERMRWWEVVKQIIIAY